MPIDPLASQRAEMLGQVVAVQFDLERALSQLMGSGGDTAMAVDQLKALAQLQRRIGQASVSDLAALRGDVAVIVAQAQTVSDQSRAAAASGSVAQLDLATASVDARSAAQSFMQDFYDRKIFDRYLRFNSAEDEAEYRKREEANRKATEAALAEGTPAGDAQALEIEKRQLRDAGAHGADKSPEFGRWMQALDQKQAALSQAMAEGERTPPTSAPPQAAASATIPSDADVSKALAVLQSVGATAPLASNDQTGHGLSNALASTGQLSRV